ncbi:uncharacterized protein LOC127639367 [Xyrauchen texanus]|uniref:uncharacterized protein LOC127639367 n=1 Tax=Xyrauchen texanus TaxID=154827 RepID=UPI002241F3D6|nr:uncharacterized protein LOC127639367 [Xyrauchen texanus]XP_051977289.1 uncharacterized protein LOC127639367 [Xyrauchen texanus]
MGRHQENPAHRYFFYDKVSNKSFCKIEGCGAEISGHHGGNLQRHLQRRHPAEHAETTAQKRPASVDGLTTLDVAVVKRAKITGLHVQLSPNIIKDACIELVTINGRPLSLMEDSGFRKIIDPIQEAIGNDFNINSTNICEMVSDVAQGEREQLKNELNGRLLMLKIDSATCRDRTVLCINVQYADGDKIVMHTLAVKELTERHTTEYISSVAKDVLHEYNVELRQVYSVTSDNGVNMVKEVYLLSDMQDDDLSNNENYTDAAITLVKEELTEAEVGSQELDIELDTVMQGHVLRSVRCPAHTFQLAIDDALKEKWSSSLICKARRVAKELRTQNIVIPRKKMGHERAIVDCATCWQSTHDMLEWLLELRSFCEDMSSAIKALHLIENEWQDIANLVCALKPAKIAAKSLQSDQLTAGDFYGVWLQCVLCTDKIDNLFAKRLVQCLTVRQTRLFDSDAFVAALFLDPRYRLFLTDHQTERAKVHLTRAWEAIKNVSTNSASSTQCTPSQSSEEDDEIEQLLMAKELQATKVQSSHVSISSLLDVYSRGARLKRSECLFKYWASIAPTNPDLHKLAMNVIALPVTQVSLKRANSCLEYILSEPALSMNAQVLENILFLRLNKQYGHAVNYK